MRDRSVVGVVAGLALAAACAHPRPPAVPRGGPDAAGDPTPSPTAAADPGASAPAPTGPAASRQQDRLPPVPAGERSTLLVSINDVYRIEGVDGGVEGGIARVRTLRRRLEVEHPDLVLLHAGDLLYPSFLSRRYDGEQMIDLLNRLDGDPKGFDPRLLVVFGNHEFDQDDWSDAATLGQRIDESQFRWLGTNVAFKGKVVGSPHLHDAVLIESGGIRLGIFGLTTDLARPAYAGFLPPVPTARRLSAELRRQGAEVVVALTHLPLAEDLELLERLGDEGPDLVVGGHEHTAQSEQVDGRWVLKADADARSARLVELTVGAGGAVRIEPRPVVELADPGVIPDDELAARTSWWLERHGAAFCADLDEPRPPGCLDEVVGTTRTALVAEEISIRSAETSLGNWVAETMVAEYADRNPDSLPLVAFVNSGALRLNQDLPPGEITLRHVKELFQYDSPLRLLAIDGATLRRVAEHAVTGWPGNGRWLQIAGFAYRHRPPAEGGEGSVVDLTLLTPNGPRPVEDDEKILAVTVDYLVNPKRDQDGYTMLEPEQVIDRGRKLEEAVLEALDAARGEGIAPRVEGRICQGDRDDPCLALAVPVPDIDCPCPAAGGESR